MSLFRPALGVLGFVLVILSSFMLLPALLSFIGDAPNYRAFLVSFGITSIVGLTLLLFFRNAMRSPNPRKLFLITATCWIGVSAFSALPLWLSDYGFSTTDAIFEAVSGITTTGSTVMHDLDHTARDILLWRSLMQWIGGIGVIAMAVAILPFLRVGAMRLFRTESSDWSEKAVAHDTSHLRFILVVYLSISAACAGWYFLCGMDWFEAINHMMTTISTGEFSTSDDSLGHFNNAKVEWGAIFFMVVGGLPFSSYIYLARNRARGLGSLRDSQIMAFFVILLGAGLLMTGYLIYRDRMDPADALTTAFVHTTSLITTTGYTTEDYGDWGSGAIPVFFLTVVGGCSGSTSGGIKIFRLQLLWLFLKEQVLQSLHPRAVVALKYNQQPVSPDVISSFIAFQSMVTVTFMVMTVLLGLSGLDLVTSSSGALTAIMNVGPGLGDVIGPAMNFGLLSDQAKWVLCAGMLMRRLEYLTLFILLAPDFWRN